MKRVSIAQTVVIKRILEQADLNFDTVLTVLGYPISSIEELTMEQAASVLAYCYGVYNEGRNE